MNGFDFLNNFREKLDRLWKVGSTVATNKIKPLRVAKQKENNEYRKFSEKANEVDAANRTGQFNGQPVNSEMPVPEMTDTQGVDNFMGVNPEVERGILDWVLSLLNTRQVSPVPGTDFENAVPVEELIAKYAGAAPTASPTAVPTQVPTVAPTAGVAPTASPTQPDTSDGYVVPPNPVGEILAKYHIPDPIFYGMRQAEGGNIGKNNPMNLGAPDSAPQNAFNYDSPEAGIEAFARLIATDPRYAKAIALNNNPKAMLEEIVRAGYAGDPSTWKQRSIEQGGAGKYFDTYQDFVMSLDGWRDYYDE